MDEHNLCSSIFIFSDEMTTKGQLEHLTKQYVSNVKNSNNYNASIAGSVGFISPEILALIPLKELVNLVSTVFNKTFDWFEDSNKKYTVCKECGHYELLEK